MVDFTSKTYQMKREILTFSNKISRKLPKPERKFMADMNYGMLASGSCLLTDIVDHLYMNLLKKSTSLTAFPGIFLKGFRKMPGMLI